MLEGHSSRVVEPRSPLVHAWGSPPIVLRCGVGTPAGYDPRSAFTTDVNGVQWFQQRGGDVIRWTAIRRTANVELSVPTTYEEQGPFLVDIGAAIEARLP